MLIVAPRSQRKETDFSLKMPKDCLTYFKATKRKSFVDILSSSLLSLSMGCSQQNRIMQNKHGWSSSSFASHQLPLILCLFIICLSFSGSLFPNSFSFLFLAAPLPCGTIAGRAFLARVYLIIPHSTLICHIS